MSHRIRLGLAALGAATVVAIAQVRAPAQDPPAPRPDTKAEAKAGPNPAVLAKLKETVATVNGESITRRDLLNVLNQMQIPAGQEQQAYEMAVDMLINGRLVSQFLTKQKIVIPQAEIDNLLKQQDEQVFKKNNTSLEQQLRESGTTMEEARTQVARTQQWKKYITQRATEAELKKYFQRNKDVFDGTVVRASHILLKVDPSAPAEEKEKVKQRLLSIRKEIESGKISFPDAANKYSEDDANVATPNGGDLDFFPRRGTYIEPFTAAAFALKKDTISEPVETDYGWHLVQVTDRRGGAAPEFGQVRDRVFELYTKDAQDAIVADARKTAKIEIKPMPDDLFPKAPEAKAGAAKKEAK